MPKKKTNEEYLEQLLGYDYVSLEIYNGADTKILHRHIICGHEWLVKPSNILSGKGCPRCFGNMLKTTEQYIKELPREFELLQPYINNSTSILHKHLDCGHEWLVKPSTILSGKGCPKCGGTMLKTTEQYVKELPEKFELLGEYITAKTPILHRHKTCGYEWLVRPTNILMGSECPNCAVHGFNPMLPAYLYHVEFTYEDVRYFKIGITKNENLSNRFGYGDWNNLKMKELWKKVYPLGIDARNKEKELLKTYESFKINTGALKSGGNTETISIPIEEPL